ncbi:MAG: hypothetical protein HYZ15_04630 [Sphingobacteriales bacterium]|nr:hypothetical protein [Sphingobacteriales bacterium]
MATQNSTRPNEIEEWRLVDYLITSVTNTATGVSFEECHSNRPRDKYFIGNLSPREENQISLSRTDYLQKISPSAFGAEFRLKPGTESATIEVKLSWDLYYRVFPTYEQQRDLTQPNEEINDESADIENGTDDADETNSDQTILDNAHERRRGRRQREDLFIRFKKIKCLAFGTISFELQPDGEWRMNNTNLEQSLHTEIGRALDIISEDDDRLRLRVAGQLFTIQVEDLESPTRYYGAFEGFTIGADNQWHWQVVSRVYSANSQSNDFVLSIQFVNDSPDSESKTVEPYIFNTNAEFKFRDDIIIPFELDLAPQNFRYKRTMVGKGFNCGLAFKDGVYYTDHTPRHIQYRYITNDDPEAKFSDLSKDPIPVLKLILSKMREYLNEWDHFDREWSNEFGSEEWNLNYRADYLRDREQFEAEIQRFEQGLGLIMADPEILLAFTLSNESFRRAGLAVDGTPKKVKWRLFQIVFMVSQIPGIAALNPKYEDQFAGEREFVDIIYFPTGGGKTEAYLAVLVFHCFYDRLRSKTAGVTCWIRFPLRLLTLQQTQRLADIIGTTEIIRLEQSDVRLNGPRVEPFSIGYYVGTEATPNKIYIPPSGGNANLNPDLITARDPQARQKWKRIVLCPACKTPTVSVEFIESTVSVLHKCSNTSCRFPGGVIPIYIIDTEIYRHLPSVIVGTIDKLAIVGMQRNVAMFFGKVDGYCETHGFYNDVCVQDECKDKKLLKKSPPLGISGPTLFLQDELHLLNEGFGTFDSHYESFVRYLLKHNDSRHILKMIASSATIEKYQRQVEHLYGKQQSQARIFPGIGPTLEGSFYATTLKHPQRIFVGILPHNKTLFNSVLEIIEYYHGVINNLLNYPTAINPYGGSYVPNSQEWNDILNWYSTSLGYFLAKKELEQIHADIETDINPTFFNAGIRQVDVYELTSDTTTGEVAKTLEILEMKRLMTDAQKTVLATNMISHGVDIDRLNFMFFYGMPRKNAEYIQASSRVGRSHVGIIFDCLHPIRERDQSHYAYFEKYHEYLGQLVEPVAINRWSGVGLRRTLPGLFMGVILQIMANRETTIQRKSYRYLNTITRKINSREITKEEIKRLLKNAFEADIAADPRNADFITKIDTLVDQYFSKILSPSNMSETVGDALYPRPLTSLRAIDDPVEVTINNLGQEWLNKS